MPGETWWDEIVDTEDDKWAEKWSPVIQRVTSEYNSIQRHKRQFNRWYLEDAHFGELWHEAGTAATRIENALGLQEAIIWIEDLKRAIDKTGRIFENFIVSSIWEVNGATHAAMRARATAVERIRRHMEGRIKNPTRLVGFHQITWDDTW